MKTENIVFANLNKFKNAKTNLNLYFIQEAIDDEKKRINDVALPQISAAYRLYDLIFKFLDIKETYLSELKAEMDNIDVKEIQDIITQVENLSQNYNIEFSFEIIEGIRHVETYVYGAKELVSSLEGINRVID
jgi:hypothetical protein